MFLPRCYHFLLGTSFIFFIFMDIAFAGDKFLTTTETVQQYGYPAEAHTVPTKDGYLLTMHRIPYGRRHNSKYMQPVVMLQHGLVSSSYDWVIAGPGESLAYILADNGYDVWMGNARGNGYSNNHTTLDPNSYDFWKFSFDEMGEHDLAAEIDYILKETGQSQIYYIGHSMGTTMFFALLSTRPEYNDKIKLAVALAPVAYVNHTTGVISHLAAFTYPFQCFVDLFKIGQFVKNPTLLHDVTNFVCDENLHTETFCANVLFIFSGYNETRIKPSLLPLLLQHSPAETSTRTILHFGQLYNSGRFAKFDHGLWSNVIIYKSIRPPSYDLSKVRAPVALFSSDNDLLVNATDFQRLQKELPKVVKTNSILFKEFTHIDFMYAKDAPKLVYSQVLKMLKRYGKK